MQKTLPFRLSARARAVSFVLALLGLPGAALAQNELSNFTATGRGGVINTFATEYQAIGINPANLGIATGAKVAFTLGEVGVGLTSRTASRTYFNKLLYNTDQRFLDRNAGGIQERRDLAAAFTGEGAASLAADVTPFAISFYSPGFGGLAFNTRYRMVGQMDLSKNAAQLLFMGNDADIIRNTPVSQLPLVSEALKGTRIQLQAVQEFNLAYGRTIVEGPEFTLYGGVGIKYLRGIGILDLTTDGGKLSAYGALSPVFDASYPTYIKQNTAFNYKTSDNASAAFPGVGSGAGLDIGISAQVAKKLRLALSVVDIGTMTWKANLLEIKDQKLQQFGNFDDGSFYDGPTNYNLWKALKPFNISGDSVRSPLRYKVGGERKVKLPMKLRAGAGYKISDRLEVGADYLLPFDSKVAGAFRSGLFGVGLDYKPLWWLKLSTGANGGGGFGFGLPIGISFSTKSYEAGFGTRSVLGFFGEKNPYISFATGFLRFKIGTPNNRQ